MIKFYKSLRFAMVFLGFLSALSSTSQNFPKLSLNLDNIELHSGESYQLPTKADFIESNVSKPFQVEIKWNINPGYLGQIDRNGILTTRHPGEGLLIAKYKNYRISTKLIVFGEQTGDEEEIEEEHQKVKIIPGNVKITVGDSIEFRAFYIDETGEKKESTFNWSVEPADLGDFINPENSMFYSGDIPGRGIIIASVGELSDTVRIQLIENIEKKEKERAEMKRQMIILPGDMIVQAGGEPIQYSGIYRENGKKHEDVLLEWKISNENIGTINSETGLLTPSGNTGMAIISATYSNFRAFTELLVIDPDEDPVVNTITIHCVLPNGNELKTRTIKEGDTYKIGGLPYPLNILNAGMLHFPFGCLEEDITLYMFIPEEYAVPDDENSELGFNNEIINGIKFSIMPANTESIVEPYYFKKPVILSLVFKRGLLASLKVNPENLDVFFADNAGFIKDGADNVVVDTVRNKIYVSIEHFSTIVIRKKSSETYVDDLIWTSAEEIKIYPNPFNISTNIRFQMTEEKEVKLLIYNIFGQQVKKLVNEVKREGSYVIQWNGTDESGAKVPTGIYICRMLKNENVTSVARIVLNR